jgi:hypothetical protein
MQASLTGIRQRLSDMGERWGQAKQTKTRSFWIAIGAVVLVLFLGFTQGGWTTGGSARQMAETSAQNAVTERLAPICVAQFNADAHRAVRLEELMAINSTSKRITFVKEQGWATMPGESDPDNRVATACANQLKLITE